MLVKGNPIITIALAKLSLKSYPSESLPLQTEIRIAPSSSQSNLYFYITD